MIRNKINSRAISLFMAIILALGMFVGMPLSVSADAPYIYDDNGLEVRISTDPGPGCGIQVGITDKDNPGADVDIFNQFENIRKCYTLVASSGITNVAEPDIYVVLPDEDINAYVYIDGLMFAGRGSDHLPIATKYYVSDSVLDIDEPAGFSINFDANGGHTDTSSLELNEHDMLNSIPTATRSGYTFNGWYTARTGGTRITTSYVFIWTSLEDNITIYAQWTANSSGGSSGGSSSGGGGGSSPAAPNPATQTSSNVNANGAVDSKSALSDLSKALKETAKNSTATLNIKNAKEITVSTISALAKAEKQAGKPVTINADTIGTDGKIVARITIDPANFANVKNPINLQVDTNGAAVENRKALFEKYYDNKVSVISCGQQGTYGASIKMAVKIDLPKHTDNLKFYSYDKTTGKYSEIVTTYTIDKNGFLKFSTSMGGDIIISDKPLAKKK